jgi:hypothetical protein
MISTTGTRPLPSRRLASRCETTAIRFMPSWVCCSSFCAGSNSETMRSTVMGALVAWTVVNTRCPVSAARRAVDSEKVSRISPIISVSGVLAHHLAQGVLVALAVGAHLHLADQRLDVVVLILDGVLDADDALGPRAVDLADDGRQRRGLTTAGGARDHDQAAVVVAQLLDLRRQVQLVEVGDPGHDPAHHDRVALPAVEDVDAESRLAVGHGVGQVDSAPLLEDSAALVVLDQLADILVHQLVADGRAVQETRPARPREPLGPNRPENAGRNRPPSQPS